jgi:hypothetical protein
VGLIRTRRRWIEEERERLKAQMDDLQDLGSGLDGLRMLKDRLGDKLAQGSWEDQRFVLDAVGASVLAPGDGDWELELPQEPPAGPPKGQIGNAGPSLGWGPSLPPIQSGPS